MKKIIKKKKGFTLIELLVVVAIIATLAAISIPIGLRVYNNALGTKAKSQMKTFVAGSDRFYKDYGVLVKGDISLLNGGADTVAIWASNNTMNPANMGSWASSNNLYKHLVGLDGCRNFSNYDSFNPRKIVYVKLPDATPENGVTAGWIRYPPEGNTAQAFVDPWGRAYIVVFDPNYDGKILSAGSYMGKFKSQNITMSGHVGLICFGKDRNETEDDFASWE